MKAFRKLSKKAHSLAQTKSADNEKKPLFIGKPKSKGKNSKSKRKISTAPIARFAWFIVGIFVIVATGFSFFLPIFKNATALDYFDYVSELRSNILIAEKDSYALKVYAVEKEYPYSTDGVKRETTTRTEIYFTAPSGDKSCQISFTINDKRHEGEASYDNVKAEYFLSYPADFSSVESLDFTIRYGEESFTMTAKTIKTEKTLTPRQALTKLRENAPSVFENLTSENAFVGEIYLRLISENSPYYYIGLIEKNGTIQAYLLNSENGKILAKREQGATP
jgi:hypothetical protein